jgi:hypothetical protein
MSGACSTHRCDDTCTHNLVNEPEGNRPLGRHRRMWEDNIKLDIEGIGREIVDCIQRDQDRDL